MYCTETPISPRQSSTQITTTKTKKTANHTTPSLKKKNSSSHRNSARESQTDVIHSGGESQEVLERAFRDTGRSMVVVERPGVSSSNRPNEPSIKHITLQNTKHLTQKGLNDMKMTMLSGLHQIPIPKPISRDYILAGVQPITSVPEAL